MDDLNRLLALLPTTDHKRAVPLFDKVIQDLGSAGPVLQELVYVASNHDDPQLHTPHGLLTLDAGRELLQLTRPPGGLGLLRFLFLYNFTLQRRAFDASVARAMANSVPTATPGELAGAYRKAVGGGLGDQAASVLGRLAADHGLEAASHLALRTALDDLGRLGHNLVTAMAYVTTAEVVGPNRHLVPLMNLARLQAFALQDVPVSSVPQRGDAGDEEASVVELEAFVVDGAFDRVEGALQALAFAGHADEAYRPLLVAASADPGFLGHSLSLVHAARLASRFLTPSENTWLSWRLYRTLTARFGYPEFLRLSESLSLDRSSLLPALESSLQNKSPPVERTLRQALENGVSLDELLATVVNFYGNWTVGEKEHTISYLNAALQTAKFLGRDDALLPLTIALGKLPF
ncbi:MAG TPA: hypothetical protein VEY12_11985 [Thermoplasmata archaeon]|nr:hypothetical protein [Thermoplasmata archaeon]